jgi:hypothetical protein
MLRAIRDALRAPWSLAAGIAAGLAVFVLTVWLPNLGLIWSVVTSGSMSLAGKAGFLWDSLGAIHTNFTPLGAWLTIAAAVLFGLNVAVALHYVRRRAAEARAGGAALGGLVLALTGAGCSSCGAIVLSTLFGVGASASFVARLPLRGEEFAIASVLVLAATLMVTARLASRSEACAIEPPSADHGAGSAGGSAPPQIARSR